MIYKLGDQNQLRFNNVRTICKLIFLVNHLLPSLSRGIFVLSEIFPRDQFWCYLFLLI